MSMPDTLTIYKVPFGEDGFLLSFIPAIQGRIEEEAYIKESTYLELSERHLDLHVRLSEALEDLDYMKYKLREIADGPTT